MKLKNYNNVISIKAHIVRVWLVGLNTLRSQIEGALKRVNLMKKRTFA